jgi:hypothetical protein
MMLWAKPEGVDKRYTRDRVRYLLSLPKKTTET